MTTTITSHESPNGVAYTLRLIRTGEVLLAAAPVAGELLELVFPTAEAAHQYAEVGLVGSTPTRASDSELSRYYGFSAA